MDCQRDKEGSVTKQLDNLKKKDIGFIHGKIEKVDPQNKQVTVMPFKCPDAPYEAALQINSFLKKKGKKASIEIYSPESGPMGVGGKKLSDMVRGLVESRGVKYFPEHHATNVSGNTISFKNDVLTNFDLLAYVPKHQCPKVIKDTDLVDESGWVKVSNNKILETKYPGVYAIGDITNIPLVQGKPLPKAGVFAHYQAQTVANNIAVEITGKGAVKQFTGDGMCFIELGEGKAGFAKGNFYAEPMPASCIKEIISILIRL